MGPNKEHIVNVTIVVNRFEWGGVDNVLFELCHEYTSIGWGHPGPHCSTLNLEIIRPIEGKVIVG